MIYCKDPSTNKTCPYLNFEIECKYSEVCSEQTAINPEQPKLVDRMGKALTEIQEWVYAWGESFFISAELQGILRIMEENGVLCERS